MYGLWETNLLVSARAGSSISCDFAVVTVTVSPIATIANRRALKRMHHNVPRYCTSLCLQITVI